MSEADRNKQGLPAGIVVSLGDSLKFIIKGTGTVTPRAEGPPGADASDEGPETGTTHPPTPPPPDHRRI